MMILIVDDSAGIRFLMETLFSLEGHEVLIAENGVKAFECLQQWDIDMMFLDMVMPRMSGVQMLAQRRVVRSRTFPEDFKIVVMTATPDLVPPGYPILEKPFELEDALEYVQWKNKRSKNYGKV